MTSKFKITDGDMVMVNLKGKPTQDYLNRVRDRLEKWAKAKGLSNVEFLMSGGDINVQVNVLTVNDVFEDEVLKGDSNG